MTACLLGYVVGDLCLGKPALRSLSITSTVADALASLKSSEDNYISVWSCDHSKSQPQCSCLCIGKINMVDIICYLSKQENFSSPSSALKSPLSLLVSKVPHLVKHLEPSSSLIEAIDLILQGTQNLVIPIKTNLRRKPLEKSSNTPTGHNGCEYCWVTQEDVMRFLLSSIGLFSPMPAQSIESLGLITTKFSSIWYHSPASEAVTEILNSQANQTSVAVVDEGGILIGEISPFTLACCDEIVAATITTLSAGDLMAYIDCGGPPEDIVRVLTERLKERNLEGMLDEFSMSSSGNLSLSSDEESFLSPVRRSSSYSARMVRRAEAIVCHPWSSLMAVMIQAIAHRVNYVWVIEEDCSLVGIVTFSKILGVFREHLQSMI